ncbi:MAG: hypothetical protein V1743_04160 [Nanoarchaeota archaeon]
MANPRQTAYKCRIADLLTGFYVVKEGWEPNYVETRLGRISRANIIGVVVSVMDEKNFLLDDGSGRMHVRSFDEGKSFAVTIGEIVLIIGRPRKYNEEMYLVPEIVKLIEDKVWIELRKKELDMLEQAAGIPPETAAQTPEAPGVVVQEQAEQDSGQQELLVNSDDLVLEKIKALDAGEGVDIDDLVQAVQVENAEKRVQKLLEEGQIFMIKPGRVKAL